MPPLTRVRANKHHVPTSMMRGCYTQRRSEPETLLITEATLVSATHAPGIWSEEHVAGWRKITNAIHVKGSYMICQLVAPGRAVDVQALADDSGHKLLSSSAVARPVPVPREMTDDELEACVHDFLKAAQNAISAGFDDVEVHGANGYLLDQFLQDA